MVLTLILLNHYKCFKIFQLFNYWYYWHLKEDDSDSLMPDNDNNSAYKNTQSNGFMNESVEDRKKKKQIHIFQKYW